jgi:hypothetical protein
MEKLEIKSFTFRLLTQAELIRLEYLIGPRLLYQNFEKFFLFIDNLKIAQPVCSNPAFIWMRFEGFDVDTLMTIKYLIERLGYETGEAFVAWYRKFEADYEPADATQFLENLDAYLRQVDSDKDEQKASETQKVIKDILLRDISNETTVKNLGEIASKIEEELTKRGLAKR